MRLEAEESFPESELEPTEKGVRANRIPGPDQAPGPLPTCIAS